MQRIAVTGVASIPRVANTASCTFADTMIKGGEGFFELRVCCSVIIAARIVECRALKHFAEVLPSLRVPAISALLE